MEIIGERINGMFKDIKEAIIAQDKKVIQDWAIKHLNKLQVFYAYGMPRTHLMQAPCIRRLIIL